MRARLVLPLILVAVVTPGWSQSRSAEVLLGARTLKLGMGKDQVIAMLAASYAVEPAGDEDWWSVSSKKPYTPATPYTFIANLGFESGKLVYVLKRRFDAGQGTTAPALARAFHVILTEFLAQQGNSCEVSALRYDFPESEQRRVSIRCGQKVLTMDADHWDGLDSVIVEEVVGSLPNALQPKKRH